MSAFPRPAIRALGLTLTLSALAGAQEQSCDVNEGRPNQVAQALLSVQIASGTANPAEAAKQLTKAVKLLTDNGEKMDNQPGRNLVLGKALVLWSTQPNITLVTSRGTLGYSTQPEVQVDLAAAIDSAFKVVETAVPECVGETSKWRGQQPFIDLVNSAIELLPVSADSAGVQANRAIMMNPYSPYGYVILAQVKQQKGEAGEAFPLYRKSVELASKDTIYDDIKHQSLMYLGNLNADSADAATDSAAKKAYVRAALDAFNGVVAEVNEGQMASMARAGLCRVAIASGDTAELRQTYKAPLENPAAFSYSDVMNAGVCLARAEMTKEATSLFRAAYQKNPWHRDALSNLAITLIQANQHEAALPFTGRLLQVDPNNEENLQLAVLAYAGMVKKYRDARTGGASAATKTGAKQAASKPKLSAAVSDSLFRIEKAYTDSAVATSDRRDKLAYAVTLNDFSASDQKAVVSGLVRNQGQESKPITVEVQFLDKDGNVIQTQTSDLGTINAGETSRFSVTAVPGTGIAAFKYTPIK